MKSISLQLAVFVCMSVGVSSAGADDSFQQWMQQQAQGVAQQKKEFQEYRDERDREFTAFLKAQWKAVDIVAGEKLDEAPKPDVMPVAPVSRPVTVTPETKPVVVKPPPPPVIKQPIVAPVVAPPEGRPLDINFFGRHIRFTIDDRLQQNLAGGINKESIADYWSALSRTDYEDLLKQLQAQKASLQLTDWAYAAMVHELAMAINKNRRNESVLLSWFLLTKTGYRARVAYNSASIFLLVPSKQELFDVPYFTFSNKRYYAVAFDGGREQPGTVYTYDGEYPDTINTFDMKVTSLVAVSDKDDRRHLSFTFEGRQYNIEAV